MSLSTSSVHSICQLGCDKFCSLRLLRKGRAALGIMAEWSQDDAPRRCQTQRDEGAIEKVANYALNYDETNGIRRVRMSVCACIDRYVIYLHKSQLPDRHSVTETGEISTGINLLYIVELWKYL